MLGCTHPHSTPSTSFPPTPRRQFVFRGSQEKSTSRRRTIELKTDGRRSARPLLPSNTTKSSFSDGLNTPINAKTSNNHAIHKEVAQRAKPKSGTNEVPEHASRKSAVVQTVVHITKSSSTMHRTGKPIVRMR
ncbi:unnamed protein product, partial [Phytomonas sp. Hart1]